MHIGAGTELGREGACEAITLHHFCGPPLLGWATLVAHPFALLRRGARSGFLVRHGFTRIGLFLTSGFGLAGVRKARAFTPRCTAILGPLHTGCRTGFLVVFAMRLRLGVGIGRGFLGVASRKRGRCSCQGEGNKERLHDFSLLG